MIGSFLVGIYGPGRVFSFVFKSRQIYLQLKLLKENMLSTTKKTTMNELIVRQMKEFSDSLPASELEHLCVHLHFTFNEEVFIQHTKNNKFKNRKENWY